MLGSPLKTHPVFDYHQSMQRAVLTLLVGLMLSLGGGASALTFKSDGTVVQNDGTVSPNSWSQPDLSNKADLTISLGNEFPKFMSSLAFTCKNPAGDVWDRNIQVFFDDNHLVGWDSGGGWIRHVTGKRTESGTIKILISRAGSMEDASQNWLKFSWKDVHSEGFFSISKQNVIAKEAGGKDKCSLSIRHSNPSTAPVISIRADRDTSFQIKNIKKPV